MHLIAAAVLCLTCAGLGAATVDLALSRHDPQAVLAALRNLGLGRHEVPITVATDGALPRTLTIHLARADVAAVRQALAFAVDGWWSEDGQGTTLYRPDLTLPLGPLSSRTYTSNLIGRLDRERLVQEVLAPWLGRAGCGLALDAGSGTWAATLDSDGHRRLIEVLDLLERGTASVPSWIPPPGNRAPDLRLGHGIQSDSWDHLALTLGQVLGVSIALHPRMPPISGVITLPAGSLAEASTRLAALGLGQAWINGVWCWGGEAPQDRQHPAQRRRLALVPAPSLCDETSLLLLRGALGRHDPAWTMPGACLVATAPDLLLVGSDVQRIHRVWDLAESSSRIGLDAALTAFTMTP